MCLGVLGSCTEHCDGAPIPHPSPHLLAITRHGCGTKQAFGEDCFFTLVTNQRSAPMGLLTKTLTHIEQGQNAMGQSVDLSYILVRA